MKAKKYFGQNFLVDEAIKNKIISEIKANDKDLIIEIGPGQGALTKLLKNNNSFLIAYEVDKDLKEQLDSLEDNKTKIIYQDILKANIKEDIKDYNYNNIFIVGNLPYYITTPIIEHITKQNLLFNSFVIMVQKEVADRFMAKPGTKEYGYFTVYLNYYYETKKICNVSKTAFKPVPKVDSAVIKLIPKEKKAIDEDKYFAFLKRCFQQKRKTLKNNITKEEWEKAKKVLEKHNLKENIRAEQLNEDVLIDIFAKIW